MDSMASQITSLTIAYSAVYSGENQRKHQSSASLAFVGNSPVTGELSAQMASNAEIISIWWRHHAETAGNIHHLRHRRKLSDSFILFYRFMTIHFSSWALAYSRKKPIQIGIATRTHTDIR